MSKPTLFLDTEFNGFGGTLLSMALVGLDGEEFYEVIENNDPINPWVAENVVPLLNKDPINRYDFCSRLEAFLEQHMKGGRLRIVADWPADIQYFLQYIMDEQDQSRMIVGLENIDLIMDRNLRFYQSKVPHNALEDARAMRALYIADGRDE